MLPSSNQLVADAMRELAEAHRQWRRSCQVDEEESSANHDAYVRNKAAEDRLLELALSLYPASPSAKRSTKKGAAS